MISWTKLHVCSVIIESSEISNLDSLAQGQCGDKARSFGKVLRMNQTDEWLLLANCLLADHINMRSNLEDVQLLIHRYQANSTVTSSSW